MTVLEIPRVESLAAIADPLANIGDVLGFLLTSLVSRPQALLHAEYVRPAEKTAWHIRSRSGEREGADEVLAVLPSAVSQSCIARLAVSLNFLQTGSGYAPVVLTQAGRRNHGQVFLSNCRESGCWIRIYAE